MTHAGPWNQTSSQLPALIPDLDLDVAAQLFPCLGIVVDVEPKHQPQERTRTLPSGNHQTWHWESLHFWMSVPMKTSIHKDFLMIFVCHVTFDSPRLIDTIPGVFLFNPHLLWDSGFRNQTETLQLFAKGMPPHQQRSPWLDADFRHAEIALALAKTSKMLFVDGKIVYLRRMRLSSAAGEERVFLRQALWGFTDHHSRSSAAPKKWIRICQQERILTKEQIA